MNITEIRDNFIKIYGGDEKNLRAFSVCSALRLAGCDAPGFDCLSLSLSPATTAVVREKSDRIYKIINSDSDVMYQCGEDKLLDYGDDMGQQGIFRAIALTKGNVKGAEILLNYSADRDRFKNPVTTVAAALSLIGKNALPSPGEISSLADSGTRLDKLTECKLGGRQNTVTLKSKNGSVGQLAFYLTGYKLIIAKIKNTRETAAQKIHEAVKKAACNTSEQDPYERFCVNEQKRAERLCENIAACKAVNGELADILKNSARELCSLTGKYGHTLFEAYKAAEDTRLAAAILVAYDYSGICAIVSNAETDNFVNSFSQSYERRQGSSPEFYICNTADSGIELDMTEYRRQL